MTDPAPPLDRATILAALQAHKVKFVLVGGLAAQAYGASRVTQDADICPQWNLDNLSRLADSLRELTARLKIGEASIDTLEMEIDAHTIHQLEIGAWRTSAGDVDILLGIPGASRAELVRYEQLAANATSLEIDSLHVLVASLDDIIRSKEVADRPKDREVLNELRALRGA